MSCAGSPRAGSPLPPSPFPPSPLVEARVPAFALASTSPRRALRAAFHEKLFEPRESLLTELDAAVGPQGDMARAALHVAVAAMVWFAVHLLLKENRSSGVLGVGASALQLARSLSATAEGVFGRAGVAAALLSVAALHVLAALCVPLLQLLTRGGRIVPSRMRFAGCLALYVALQCALLAAALAACVALRLPPASGFGVMCEGVRLTMKVHAMLREKVVHGVSALAEAQAHSELGGHDEKRRKRDARRAALRCSLAGEEDGRGGEDVPRSVRLVLPALAAWLVRFRDYAGGGELSSIKSAQPRVRIDGWPFELRRFAFFVFAPTMIYRDAYPRSPGSIDSAALLAYAGGFAATVGFGLLVVRGMVEPALASLRPRQPATLANYFNTVFELMAPSALLFLATFFAVLHCWLNFWAVALRFADRRFYGAWWTSRTWGAWYRSWNSVVGEWIWTYVYNDLQRLGAGRGLALSMTFLLSAVLHELILAGALGFLFPALFVAFAGPGVGLLWFTRCLPPRTANTFLWLALSLGVSLLFVVYLDESGLRDNGGRKLSCIERLLDAVAPRSLAAWAAAAAASA
jgi:sterol O-acyltransferase